MYNLIKEYSERYLFLSEERSRYRKLIREEKDEELKEKYKLDRSDLGTEISITAEFLTKLRELRSTEL